MKRVACLLLIMMLCISLACPVYAAENGFVPSITYKGEPELIPFENEQGDPVIGIVREEEKEDKIISYIYDSCLVLTPVAEAKESTVIPQEAAEELLYVYEELSSGRMKLPYDKAGDYMGENMVILELLDGTWLCGPGYDHDHPTEVAPDGIVFDITFDLGVAADAKVIVMTYHDGEWEPITKVENNGDGTVKCTFEHLCPIAISIAQSGPVEQDAGSADFPWLLVMVAALMGVVTAVTVYSKKKTKR